jgi:O-antigen/teichoic acid export membrane protein
MLSSITLAHAVLAQSISYIPLIVIGFYFVKLRFLFVKRIVGDLKSLVSFSSYLGIARSLTAVASRLDVLMLFALLSASMAPSEAGIYAGAVRFIAPYPLFAGSFSTVIAPRIATFSHHHELKKFLKKVILVTLSLIASVFVFIVLARPFLYLFLGIKSEPSVPVLQLLLVSQIFFVASIPAVSLAIYYLKKPYILTVNSVIQILIVIVGNLIFIPKFGRFGPAISLIFAYGITLILTSFMSFYYLKKENG